MVDNLQTGGFFNDKVTKSCLFSSIHDAVLYCQTSGAQSHDKVMILYETSHMHLHKHVFIHHKILKCPKTSCTVTFCQPHLMQVIHRRFKEYTAGIIKLLSGLPTDGGGGGGIILLT